jgi:cyclophilin family peptidyl-prolyl cis-trans isomerase
MRAWPILERLFADNSAQVRLAALPGLLEADEGVRSRWAEQAVVDPDPAVRAVALEWLTQRPVVPAEKLWSAITGPAAREVVAVALNGIEALRARGLSQPLERGLTVRLLEQLAATGEYPARLRAAAALEALSRPRPAVGAATDLRRTTAFYRQLLRRAEEARFLDLRTNRGTLRLRLDCPRAPLTCLNFVQLADQGFFDGQVFHRVVPDFVVQGGDPRGDGWGGPGYTIRDELSARPFGRGVIGMALSGPDTGGSQFFITLSPQPHLDGHFTAFGEVVAGWEVLNQIVQGDRIEGLSGVSPV